MQGLESDAGRCGAPVRGLASGNGRTRARVTTMGETTEEREEEENKWRG